MSSIDLDYNRIARSYDSGRGYSPEVAAELGASIIGRCGPRPRILEIGIGTGRVAHPVAAAGATMVGVDIARDMLTMARAKGISALAKADAARLPLRDECFDAVLAVQVLHHVPDLQSALTEALRVLRPGGRLLYGSDRRDPQARTEQLRRRLRDTVAELAPQSRPPAAGAQMRSELARLGAATEPPLIAASWSVSESPTAVLKRLAGRNDLFSWALPDDLLQETIARVHAWAEQTWDNLDQPEEVAHQLILDIAVKA